jgi:hypothetical protein
MRTTIKLLCSITLTSINLLALHTSICCVQLRTRYC